VILELRFATQAHLFLNLKIEEFSTFMANPCATSENTDALYPEYHSALYEELIFPCSIGSTRKSSIPLFSYSSPDFASGHI
jgi:hypothetical protein